MRIDVGDADVMMLRNLGNDDAGNDGGKYSEGTGRQKSPIYVSGLKFYMAGNAVREGRIMSNRCRPGCPA